MTRRGQAYTKNNTHISHHNLEAITKFITFAKSNKNPHHFLDGHSYLRGACIEKNIKDRVTFYVDGFNFYYGLRTQMNVCKSWYQAYWIDMVKLFEQFLSEEQELVKVIYFTASPLSPDKSSRQSAFLNANRVLNKGRFEIVRGKYLIKYINCPNCNYAISRPEEKKTDVNISVRMMGDCVQNLTDTIVLVSGDSDLLPPIEFIQKNYPQKKVRAFFPPAIFSRDIAQNIKQHRHKVTLLEKNLDKFVRAQMPNQVLEGNKKYIIPEEWDKKREKYYRQPNSRGK